MKSNMSDNILELGKMYKTPWEITAYLLGSDGNIDYDAPPRVLDDGEYVVILGVEKIDRLIRDTTSYYILKLLIGTGEIAMIQVTKAAMNFWKKV